MAGDIRGIVRECPQSESVLIRILALQQQLPNEITAAYIVHQVAEFHAAKGIVAEVLDDRTAIGIAVRFLELLFGERWESLKKQWAELIGPQQVDDFLVRKNGVSKRTRSTHQ